MITGIDRLIEDLTHLNFEVFKVSDKNGLFYAVITGFIIPAGSFAGRVINLAIPAPTDYPRSLGASIHISPHIAEFKNVKGLRNVIASPLGPDWQYWSYSFQSRSNNPTTELISQINEIFKRN
jgi:hypothetical protein